MPAQNIDDVLAAIQNYGGNTSPDAALSSAPPDPVADQFTWESGSNDPAASAPKGDASRWDSSLDQIDLPPVSVPDRAVHKLGQSYSKSSSYSGIGGMPVAKGIFGDAERKAAADDVGSDARYNAEQTNLESDYAAKTKSLLEQGKLEREHQSNLAGIEDRVADFHQTAKDHEERIYLDAKKEREQVLGDYRQQLMAVKALQQTSGNPLTGLGGGQAAAMGAAMFAQGFLAVQGVHIDVGGQLDKWIDRSLQEHQAAISNARDSANDQLHLYDIARQSSADDVEARQRFRGFALEAFKGQVNLEAARYGSVIAMSRAQQFNAESDIEMHKTISTIGDRREANHIAHKQSRFLEAKMMADAAHESAMAGESRRHNMAMEDAAKAEATAKKTAKPEQGVLRYPDPGATRRDPKTGKVVAVKNMWEIVPGATDAQKKAADDINSKQGVAYAAILKGTAKLRDLREPAMKDFASLSPIEAFRQHGEAHRAWKRQVTMTIMGMRHDIAGASLTSNEKPEWDGLLPDDSIFQSGNNAQAIDDLESHSRDLFTSAMNQSGAVRPLKSEEQDERAINDAPNDSQAAYDASHHGESRTMSPVDKAAGGVVDASRHDVDIEGGFSQAYLDWGKANGRTSAIGVPQGDTSRTASNREGRHGQTHEIDAVNHLAALILKPELADGGDTVNGESTSDPNALRRGAEAALKNIAAGGEVDGKKPNDDTRAFAKYTLKELETSDGALAGDNLREELFRRHSSKVQLDEAAIKKQDEADYESSRQDLIDANDTYSPRL